MACLLKCEMSIDIGLKLFHRYTVTVIDSTICQLCDEFLAPGLLH